MLILPLLFHANSEWELDFSSSSDFEMNIPFPVTAFRVPLAARILTAWLTVNDDVPKRLAISIVVGNFSAGEHERQSPSISPKTLSTSVTGTPIVKKFHNNYNNNLTLRISHRRNLVKGGNAIF
jgi:hypothetical protein